MEPSIHLTATEALWATAALLIAWLLIGIAVGLIVGRAVAIADGRDPRRPGRHRKDNPWI